MWVSSIRGASTSVVLLITDASVEEAPSIVICDKSALESSMAATADATALQFPVDAISLASPSHGLPSSMVEQFPEGC